MVADYEDGNEVMHIWLSTSAIEKSYNPDPKVADYKDGYEVLKLMLGD